MSRRTLSRFLINYFTRRCLSICKKPMEEVREHRGSQCFKGFLGCGAVGTGRRSDLINITNLSYGENVAMSSLNSSPRGWRKEELRNKMVR